MKIKTTSAHTLITLMTSSLWSLIALSACGGAQPADPATREAEVSPELKAERIIKEACAGHPCVEVKTSLGAFVIQLNPSRAPISVTNFLSYVDSGFYKGTVFHRVIPGFMIQGGGFSYSRVGEGSEYLIDQKETRAPIKLEANNGLSNIKFTVAMARTNERDSATSQFFVNVTNNRNLDRAGGGYAVFGKVITGFDTVEAIRTTPTRRIRSYSDVPQEVVEILSATRLTQPSADADQ